MCIGKPFAFDFEDKDSANRMQSSSLELLRCSLFSLISSAKLGIKKRPRSSGTFWEKIGNVWEDFGKKLLVSYPRLQHFI